MKIVSGLLALFAGLMLCPALAFAEPEPMADPAAPAVTEPQAEPSPSVEPTPVPDAEGPDARDSANESGQDAPLESGEDASVESGEDVPAESGQTPRAERIDVSLSADVVFPGGSFQATCEVLPRDASQRVEWSSSSSIISVDATGLARVQAPLIINDNGVYVDIWARATDGSLAMNCKTVRVMPGVATLRFFERELTLAAGAQNKTARVTVELAPAVLYGVAPVEWTSSDPSVVSVSPAGMNGEVGVLVWTDTHGTAVITARAADGSGASDGLYVTVSANTGEELLFSLN